LQDANRDGCIGWSEFEAFMMDEFAAGKHLLSGEYELPSGEVLVGFGSSSSSSSSSSSMRSLCAELHCTARDGPPLQLQQVTISSLQ
jgi:hypothetical protein